MSFKSILLHKPPLGFPGSSAGKESACNAGDTGLIPGSGRSPGEGIGYPLQYSRASLVVQMVKNPFVMQQSWVRSLGWEDPLEKDMTAHSSTLAWRIPMDRGPWGCKRSDTTERPSPAQQTTVHSISSGTVALL